MLPAFRAPYSSLAPNSNRIQGCLNCFWNLNIWNMLSLEEQQTNFSPCFRKTLVSSVFYLGVCSLIYFEALSHHLSPAMWPVTLWKFKDVQISIFHSLALLVFVPVWNYLMLNHLFHTHLSVPTPPPPPTPTTAQFTLAVQQQYPYYSSNTGNFVPSKYVCAILPILVKKEILWLREWCTLVSVIFSSRGCWVGKSHFKMHVQYYSPGGLQKPEGILRGNTIKVFHFCIVAETSCQDVLSPKSSHMIKSSATLLNCQNLQLLIWNLLQFYYLFVINTNFCIVLLSDLEALNKINSV